MNEELEKIGAVGVDSGMLVVGDPAMLLGGVLPSTWEEFCDEVGDESSFQFVNTINNHAALMVGGFGGDGEFSVYVRRHSDGMLKGVVKELVIRFWEDEEEVSE